MASTKLKAIQFDFSQLHEKEKYIKEIPSLKNILELELNNKLTYFVGENGSWKSTLIEAIATSFGFNKEWGTIHSNYKTNNIDNIESRWVRLSWEPLKYKNWFFFMAEWIYNFSNYLEEIDGFRAYWWDNLHNFSHWEQFMKIIESRIEVVWFYIIDEIESALSPVNKLKLVEIIKYMKWKWSQFIIATHSPIILQIQDSEILSFDNWEIIKTEYDFVSCVDIYKRVLAKNI